MSLRDEARETGRNVIAVGLAAGSAALIGWIKSRPIKRALAKRRARKATK